MSCQCKDLAANNLIQGVVLHRDAGFHVYLILL